MRMANELVIQVMKELARRAGGASASSTEEEVSFCNLNRSEEERLRRLARGGRTGEPPEKAAVRRSPEGRNLTPPFGGAREIKIPAPSKKPEERNLRCPNRKIPLGGEKTIDLIDLNDLASRLEGQGRQ